MLPIRLQRLTTLAIAEVEAWASQGLPPGLKKLQGDGKDTSIRTSIVQPLLDGCAASKKLWKQS